jgi:hypothetical protein
MPFDSASAKAAGSKPKKRDFLTQQIIAELNEVRADEPTKARKLVIALIDKAIEGDVPALREVLDRVEGKVTQPIGGDENNPLDLLGGLGAAIDSKLDRIIAGRVDAAKSEPDRE